MSAAVLGMVLATTSAEAAAWARPAGEMMTITQVGWAIDQEQRQDLVADGYGELGLGHGLTAVFMGDSEQSMDGSSLPVWRFGGGIRQSFEWDLLDGWLVAAEATVRYQGRDLGGDLFFAGDGFGYGARLDVGRSWDLLGERGYVNVAAGYVGRRNAPGEIKAEMVVGWDLDDDWQASVGYFGTWAPGPFYEPGAYEKQEGQIALRWQFLEDYALSLSVWQSVYTHRSETLASTTVRLGIWSFAVW